MVKIEMEASAHPSSTNDVVLLTASVMLALIALSFFWKKWNGLETNPFCDRFVRNPSPLELNKLKRKAVLKDIFQIEKIPKNLDAIVIGSGMGGLVCAGCLSRAGKKVLVLEQHNRAGGSTHTFKEKGFEFDIGLHYVGEMNAGAMTHTLFDVMSDGQLVWEPMEKTFDVLVLQQKEGLLKFFEYKSGKGSFEQKLLEYFPAEENAINGYMALLKQSQQAIVGYTMMKQLPKWLVKIMAKTGVYNLLFARYEYMTKTSLKEILDKLTANEELKIVLSYCFGDYGTFPSEVPIMMHGVLMKHFYNGAFYPRGGSSELAFHMIPGIERSGGKVLVRAPVSRILFDENHASGVCVSRNGKEFEIHAPLVISSVGIHNTYRKLIPPSIQNSLGLNGTTKELGLKKRNYWMYSSMNPERDMKEFLALPREDAANRDPPLLFVSFPSTKDSSWESRYPGKSVCVIVTLVNWEWFKEWEDERVTKRGCVYEDLKKTFQDRIWKSVLNIFPQLEEKVEYIDSGSPVSHKHYLGSPRGDIYGVDHTRKRFQYELGMELRPQTDIPGLYLTGQDIFTCGVVGSAVSGMITSGAVLGRNHFVDLFRLMGKRKVRQFMKKNK